MTKTSHQYIAGKYLNIHTKYKVSMLSMCTGEQIKEKYQNDCHLKTFSENNQKCNRHIVGTYVNIHTKYEVSVKFKWAGEQIKR